MIMVIQGRIVGVGTTNMMSDGPWELVGTAAGGVRGFNDGGKTVDHALCKAKRIVIVK